MRTSFMLSYDEDLAWIHDVGYGDFARQCAPAWLETLARHQVRRVVDIGCGSGIWARQLVDAGLEVLGVDLSPAMIEIARRRTPEAKFRVESWRTFRPPAADAFTAMGEVLGYLLDRRSNSRSLEKLFRRIHASLRPGGVFIFDLAEPHRGGDLRPLHRAGDDWACLVNYERDDARRILTRRIITFRRVGKLYRRHEERHRLQLYDARAIAQRLREIGFRVRVARAYGEFRLPDAVAGFIATKPSTNKPPQSGDERNLSAIGCSRVLLSICRTIARTMVLQSQVSMGQETKKPLETRGFASWGARI